MSEYMKLYLEGENTPLIVLYSLRTLLHQLPKDKFLRVHRSFIVATAQIKEVSSGGIILKDGTSIPVGDVFRPALKAYLSGLI